MIAGFLLSLISNDRPMYEILNPNLLDQKLLMENQFIGMTSESFSYDDFEGTRTQLIEFISHSLTKQDKDFLLSIKRLKPDWAIYDFEKFPAVRWKLQNLEKLRANNLGKYERQLDLLGECLD